MTKKHMSLINDKNQKYRKSYVNEVQLYLTEFGLKKSDVDNLIGRFENLLRKDPSYVFHYDSQYWAEYILEASGFNKLVTV